MFRRNRNNNSTTTRSRVSQSSKSTSNNRTSRSTTTTRNRSRTNQSNNQNTSNLVGKIGWCSAETLGLDRGHFVFIRKAKNGKCDVNTLTSLETSPYRFQLGKINLVRDGLIYPIPKADDNFTKFGGVDKRVIKNIPLSQVELNPNKHIDQKHHSVIKKLMK